MRDVKELSITKRGEEERDILTFAFSFIGGRLAVNLQSAAPPSLIFNPLFPPFLSLFAIILEHEHLSLESNNLVQSYSIGIP